MRLAALDSARLVARGSFERAMIIDENAFSLSQALGKEDGIRASICWDVDSALTTRKECDSNVLILNNRLLGMTTLQRIVSAWLSE
jgi:ribose 5-phosphate isomerase RpiB